MNAEEIQEVIVMNIDFYGNVNSDEKQEEMRKMAESFKQFVDSYESVGFTRTEAIQITIGLTVAMSKRGEDNES